MLKDAYARATSHPVNPHSRSYRSWDSVSRMSPDDTPSTSASRVCAKRGPGAQGCIKLLDFSLSSIGWRRGLGRGGAFLLVSPLLGPLPARSSRGEDGELDAALPGAGAESMSVALRPLDG